MILACPAGLTLFRRSGSRGIMGRLAAFLALRSLRAFGRCTTRDGTNFAVAEPVIAALLVMLTLTLLVLKKFHSCDTGDLILLTFEPLRWPFELRRKIRFWIVWRPGFVFRGRGNSFSVDVHPRVPALGNGGPDTIVVPDAQLLFSGDYKRSGLDLVLSKDGHDHLVRDYFRGEHRATLASPDGANLSGTTVVGARRPGRLCAGRRRPGSEPGHRPRHQAHRQRDRNSQRRFDHPEHRRQRPQG